MTFIVFVVRFVLFFFYLTHFFFDEFLISCGVVSEKRRFILKGLFAITTSVVGFVDYDLETKDYIRPSGWVKNYYEEKSFRLMNENISAKYAQLPVESSPTYRYLEEKDSDNVFQRYAKRFAKVNQEMTLQSNIRLRNLYFEQNPSSSPDNNSPK